MGVVYRRFEEARMETDLPEIEATYKEDRPSIANAPSGVADDGAVFRMYTS